MGFFGAFLFTFLFFTMGVPVFLTVAKIFGCYTVVEERTCKVYVLFGKVLGVIQEPGLYILPFKIGPSAFIVNFFGKVYTLDMRLDQEYRRSEAVNSEEGAPMGIGIWYEMWISDPVAYLFKNTDPRGSLRANVSNATVRCLSNMPLAEMLETRHTMSQVVRSEVSPQSEQWGYKLGSVYIRKVHFRDGGMIRQIEEKVVNRLRQVTSAIRQAGANQVSVISSSAEREASIEFAKAAAIRPNTLGRALEEIARVPAVSTALFEILETQKLVDSHAKLTLLPASGSRLLGSLLVAGAEGPDSVEPPAMPRQRRQS